MLLSDVAPPPLPTSAQVRRQRKEEQDEDDLDASMAYQDNDAPLSASVHQRPRRAVDCDEPMPAEEHIG